jgi:beta-1,2-mannobiose phosphorylase / 1,2-beta-oligomannan phosphorylase
MDPPAGNPLEITSYVHSVGILVAGLSQNPMDRGSLIGGAETLMCAGEASLAELVGLCVDRGRAAK